MQDTYDNGDQGTVRVANITEDGRIGGPQLRMVKVAEKLQAHRVETVVVCPEQNSEKFRAKLADRGVACRTLRMHRLTRQLDVLANFALRFPVEVYGIARILIEEDIDVVHCNGYWQFKGMLAAKLVGIPAVWHLNNAETPALLKWIYEQGSDYLADGYIAASHCTRDYYFHEGNPTDRPLQIIQAPVDTERFDPEGVEPDPEIAAGDGVRLVGIGAVNPSKGFDTLIRAAAWLKEHSDREFTVHIVGPHYGSKRDYVQGLKRLKDEVGADSVEFVGFKDNIPEVLQAADIFVCSSRYEASPTAVWEAMSMAKPIVATDVGDVRHHLNGDAEAVDEKRGYVVPIEDPAALGEAIDRLAGQPDLQQTFGARSREFAVENLDIGVCIRRHAEIYRWVIDEYVGAPSPRHGLATHE